MFQSPSGLTVPVTEPGPERLLRRLIQASPEPIRFAELEAADADAGTDGAEVSRSLVSLLGRGLAEPMLPLSC